MQLIHHGGKCCGIKVIHSLGNNPESFLPVLCAHSGINSMQMRKDVCGADVSSTDRFYVLEAPQETYGERLVRYIDFVKQHRPRHLIEINLMEQLPVVGWSSQANCITQNKWIPVLEGLGFRKVSSFINSNSTNRVNCFHLTIGE